MFNDFRLLVMRFKYILILLLGCCCWRCNSIDDRFEEKDNLRLIMLEAIEEPYANPKDVYVYKLMAQSMSGLERVVISNVSHELDSAPALPTIVLVDSVTVDSNGYLSRPVKTAIIEYPIVVPPLPGESISLDFTVTAVNGKFQTITSSMLVANYKESKKGLFFANTYTSKNYAFYSSEKDALYGVNPNLATYYKRNIPYIDFYSISDGAREYFIYSPTDPEVVERLKGQGITDYVLTEMRRTRMVKLEDINFTAEPGQIIGIIGSTGSGKTTLVQMIPRLYDATKGQVLVDGVDVREYSLKNLREGVGMVLQKNVLFSGTIEENLRWGKEDASMDEIREMAQSAQADSFVTSFTNGYDTDMGQGGVNVSGGQNGQDTAVF